MLIWSLSPRHGASSGGRGSPDVDDSCEYIE